MDRRDLAEALSRGTEWVRAEFSFLDDIAAGLGCERHVESGPGLAFRLRGRVIARGHPKRQHVGVGLPETMRSDVEALTGALRAQKGFAWFNYAPGVADRDTIELLLSVSADTKKSTADTSRLDLQAPSPVADDADLRLILAVLRAFKEHEAATGNPSGVKPLRETLFFRWEGPRLPPGGKYSPSIPHSPAARDHRARLGTKGLVFEHVIPVAGVIRNLLRNLPSNEDSLRQVLDATADRVLITKEEDAALTAAGYRDTSPDPSTPWSRYQALGLQRTDFAPFPRPGSANGVQQEKGR